ncbi:hypothetical protein PPL_12209 [Heterostelium album PN500]|uniref:G domain-containing protein n=1 Tax=Heterostelium pallidum (strain ATCC 26659 / Pp 5 / PN500) TaxID=670386 RepID=D3BM02_HETP5|nr:hypothetical protein PPL_12209 [Heterostelium album PN500]EFA77603.1 hypothetical protein PPL_12209 [Heterostelium album PN500]|eukprot:XP_020429731.1 hypothetical protein PPL_12209 [Heterostelium album PN500]
MINSIKLLINSGGGGSKGIHHHIYRSIFSLKPNVYNNNNSLTLPSNHSLNYSGNNNININRNYYCSISSENDSTIATTTTTSTETTKKLTSIEKNKEKKRKQKELILKQLEIDESLQVDNELTDKEHLTLLDMNRSMLSSSRCTGCGCSLQCDHPNQLGYIPKSVAIRYLLNKNKKPSDTTTSDTSEDDYYDEEYEKYRKLTIEEEAKRNFENFSVKNGSKKNMNEKETCQRCHMLKHYGKVVPIKIPVEEFRHKLSPIKDMNCVVVKVVDIMDFHGTFVENFRKIIGNNPVILVGNKMDVLPADIHRNRIEDWLRRECKLRGMVVSHVTLLSSASRDGIAKFIVELEKLRRGRDVFVVGCSNVGKSTFLNALVDEYREKVIFNENEQGNSGSSNNNNNQAKPSALERATTSIFPGTTLNIISVPLWSKSIFLGGLARIDYQGGLATFTVYVSNHLPVHICKTEKADALFERQRGKLLSPPLTEDQDRFDNDESIKLTQVKRFTITPEKIDFKHTHSDIVISGLGWIAIKPLSTSLQPMKITVHTPKGIDYNLVKEYIDCIYITS